LFILIGLKETGLSMKAVNQSSVTPIFDPALDG
jgi:hypothetical protein